MPGTYTFKPIEANLTHDTDLIGKMNPYCRFQLGNTKIKSQVCKKGGKHPHWNDAITIPNIDETSYPKVKVELMDKDVLIDDNIGTFEMDLRDLQGTSQVSKWYPLTYKNKPAGEILMEVSFQPNLLMGAGNMYQDFSSQFEDKAVIQQQSTTLHHQQPPVVFTEQQQIVEPVTFSKEVETVEIRPEMKTIEVMEPRIVTKEVPVTEPVTIRKLVEVTKPEVVTKEVEVMEPRLVTKTIQVVEDVPVKKQVEVVELKSSLEEIETVEPQTRMEEVKVTEYVPVQKEVMVDEPVTVKKEVEYVEPVITTKTVTKEVPEAVVVNEEITTSVGPATVVDIGKEKIKESKMMKEEILEEDVMKVVEEETIVKEKVMSEKTLEGFLNPEIEVKEKVRVEEIKTLTGEEQSEKVDQDVDSLKK